jgi:two-component system NtrC family sensor kinase
MKMSLYTTLQRKIIAITLAVSFAPLILLGVTIYYQFARMYKISLEEQILYRARSQAEAVDLFLKERTAILAAMADTQSFQQLSEERNLSQLFEVMNLRAGAFVDLGVINNAGQHISYVGPYNLKGLNYYQQPWFGEVMSKGTYISDVYMGYRRLPHFIIAVRRQEGENSWILRATIDSDIFGAMVRAAQLGKTGDAFIINGEGFYQTKPRFNGQILSLSSLDPNLFGGQATIIEKKDDRRKTILYAGSWLKGDKWLLVISQDLAEELTGLFATRNVAIVLIVFGITAIVLTTVFTTRLTVVRPQSSGRHPSENRVDGGSSR